MNYFDYQVPHKSHLRELGYHKPILEPSEEEILLLKLLLNDNLCELKHYTKYMNQWYYRDSTKPITRLYAYYINNQSQFNNNPNNFIGYAIRFSLNSAMSFINIANQVKLNHHIEANMKLINKYKEPILSTYYNNSLLLAHKVIQFH